MGLEDDMFLGTDGVDDFFSSSAGPKSTSIEKSLKKRSSNDSSSIMKSANNDDDVFLPLKNVKGKGKMNVSDGGFAASHDVSVYKSTDNDQSTNTGKKKVKAGAFQTMNLSPNVINGIQKLGYKVPTPIQRKAIPIALSGRDMVTMARTGSGKTAIFLIPMIEKLKEHSTKIGARGVILSPTRELALQTLRFAKALARFTDLKFAALVGGDSMEQQFALLANNPDVIIATPGRLLHHLLEVPGFHLRSLQYIAFDEADRLFEMGLGEQINEIMAKTPEDRQTMLVSATMPRQLMQFAKAGLKNPEIIRLDTDTKVSDQLKMAFFTVNKEEKPAALSWLIKNVIPSDQQVIVFVATRHHCEYLVRLLQLTRIKAETVYGQMDMEARKGHLADFVARKIQALIVTDVAARGLDIPTLDNVINYDFPDKPKLFVHRVGRVARQGRTGAAFSLVCSSDLPYMLDTFLYLGVRPSNVFVDPNSEGADAIGSNRSVIGAGIGDVSFSVDARARAARRKLGLVAPGSNEGSDDDHSVAGNSDQDSDDKKSYGSHASERSFMSSISQSTTATALSTAIRFDDGIGYSLTDMKPSQVHYGQLPRTELELEVETVRAVHRSEGDLKGLLKSATNALALYNRTRGEASRQSVARAHKLVDDRVHPLLLEYASRGEGQIRSYIAGLQSFRPVQTVLEVESAGKKKTRNAQASSAPAALALMGKHGSGALQKAKMRVVGGTGAAETVRDVMVAKRKAHSHALQPRVGAVALGPAAMAAAMGSAAVAEESVSEQLREQMIGVALSHGETIEEMVQRFKSVEELQAKREAAMSEKINNSSGQDVDDDDDSSDAEESGVKKRKLDESLENEAVKSIVSVTPSIGKRRMSKAERTRLARAGLPIDATMSRDAEIKASMAAALGISTKLDTNETFSNHSNMEQYSVDLGTASLTKSERKKRLREGSSAKDLFVDKKQYVSYEPSSSNGPIVQEAGANKEDEQDADLRGIQRLEDNVLDLVADERDEMAKQQRDKKVWYWDAVKKRYLKIRAEEVEHGRRKVSIMRNESGARIGQGGQATKHAYGTLYEKWVKKTRQQVLADGEEDAQNNVVDFGGDDDDGGVDVVGGKKNKGKGKGSDSRNSGKTTSRGLDKNGKPKRDSNGRDPRTGREIKDELKTGAEIAKERARKDRSKGKFGEKSKGSNLDNIRAFGRGRSTKGPQQSTLASHKDYKGHKTFTKGKGLAPSRSKIVGRGGISGFGNKVSSKGPKGAKGVKFGKKGRR